MRHFLFIAAVLIAPHPAVAQQCDVTSSLIPADIPVPNAQASESTFQQFSWQSFLGLNAAEVGGPPAAVPAEDPLWRGWSSTVDMLSCQGDSTPAGCACPQGDCSVPGTHFYPTACRAVPGYQHYRVLQQRGRFDNSFLQADVAGLTDSPVLDRFGNFLKYEILVSPATYNNVVNSGLWDQAELENREEDLLFSCGLPEYQGGDPANPDMGDMILKVAWMDVEGEAGEALNLNHFYTEKLLVYTPAYRSSDGLEHCELRDMAMVGLHIAHKTLRQPNWIWSTFEHRDMAPNCTEAIPGPGNVITNMSCPTSVDRDFALHGTQCNDDDPACAPCNVTPASNDIGDVCLNPTTPGLNGWCLDQGPAPQDGLSKLCRHVAVEPPVIDSVPAPMPNPLPPNYPQAAVWNQACVNSLAQGGHAPWSHYMLISGQWLNAESLPPENGSGLSCETVADQIFIGIVDFQAIEPKIQTSGGSMRPFLGNITMESYGKSNCIGCHSRGAIENSNSVRYNTDMMYFPSIQVARQSGNFMSYMVGEAVSACDAPEDPAVLGFDIAGSVVNSAVADQTIEMLLGIEYPQALPAPAISARDAMHPEELWTYGGEIIELAPDGSCAPGSCRVDLEYPSTPRRTWTQYRSVPALGIEAGSADFATHVQVTFEGLSCEDINPLDLRLWVSDNSQRVYANQVDGDYLDFTLFLLPPPPPVEFGPVSVPVLGRLSVVALVFLVLGVGLWQVRQR